MKVLVVFSEVPDNEWLVELDLDKAQGDIIHRFHARYINGAATPNNLAAEINDFFYDEHGDFRYPRIEHALTNVSYALDPHRHHHLTLTPLHTSE